MGMLEHKAARVQIQQPLISFDPLTIIAIIIGIIQIFMKCKKTPAEAVAYIQKDAHLLVVGRWMIKRQIRKLVNNYPQYSAVADNLVEMIYLVAQSTTTAEMAMMYEEVSNRNLGN